MLRFFCLCSLFCTAPLLAHEVQSDVHVRAFVKADDDSVSMLVRVPLESMRDVVLSLKGPGYLDLSSADEPLRDAAVIWIANQVELYSGEQRLTDYEIRGIRVSLPSDRSFASYETALGLISGPPLPVTTEIVWTQALLDVLLVYKTSAPETDLSIRPNLERLGMRTVTTLRFIAGNGVDRAYEFTGDPGLVRLDPRWHHAFFRFVVMGFEHILDGADHLLFILCLIIPLRRIRPLVIIVTAFTVAHSVTLLVSAFGFVPHGAACSWQLPRGCCERLP
jgi:hypothetical protein